MSSDQGASGERGQQQVGDGGRSRFAALLIAIFGLADYGHTGRGLELERIVLMGHFGTTGLDVGHLSVSG